MREKLLCCLVLTLWRWREQGGRDSCCQEDGQPSKGWFCTDGGCCTGHPSCSNDALIPTHCLWSSCRGRWVARLSFGLWGAYQPHPSPRGNTWILLQKWPILGPREDGGSRKVQVVSLLPSAFFLAHCPRYRGLSFFVCLALHVMQVGWKELKRLSINCSS